MKCKVIASVLLAVPLVVACGAMKTVGGDERLVQMPCGVGEAASAVVVENGQSDDRTVVFYPGATVPYPNPERGEYIADVWRGTYKQVTGLLVERLKDRCPAIGLTSEKVLRVKVVDLSMSEHQLHFRSNMKVEVTLGDGQEFAVSVAHASARDLLDNLNSTVEKAVTGVLSNTAALDYFKKG